MMMMGQYAIQQAELCLSSEHPLILEETHSPPSQHPCVTHAISNTDLIPVLAQHTSNSNLDDAPYPPHLLCFAGGCAEQ